MSRRWIVVAVLTAVAIAAIVLRPGGTGDETAPTRQPTITLPTPVPSPIHISLAEAGIDASALDRSASPCHDFHRFACGGWLDRTTSRRSKAWASLREENRELVLELVETARAEPYGDPARERVGAYFDACMRAESRPDLAPLRPFLSTIEQAEDAIGIAHAVAVLHRIDVPALFQVSATRNQTDLRTVVPILGSEGLFISIEGVRGVRFFAPKDARMHEKRIEERLVSLGFVREKAEVMARDAVRIRLALQISHEEMPWRRVERVDVAVLRSRVTHFEWDTYFQDMGGTTWAELDVAPKEYPRIVEDLLARESIEAVRHALTVSLLDDFGLLYVRDETTSEQRGRCLWAVQRGLSDDLGRIYVANRFTDNRRLVAWGIAGSIAEELKEAIDDAPWLDDPSREGSRARANDLALLVGFPNQPHEYGFTPQRNAWLTSQVDARMDAVKRELALIGKPVDRWHWRVPASTVNAFYHPLDNSLVFPAGILVPPFFDANRTAAVNYGAIGSVMGHELTHGMVAYGGKFQVHGTEGDRWTQETHQRLDDVKQCFIRDYSRFRTSAGAHDSKATVVEDIADAGGLQLSWNAWSEMRARDARPRVIAEGFTEEQLFFMSYAQILCQQGDDREKHDPHSPGRIRVLGALTNTTAFGQSFGCARGDPMMSDAPCTVW